MTNADYNSINDFDDVATIYRYKERIMNGMPKEESLEIVKATTRDNARTPMQWSNTKNGGFTNGDPWLKVNKNYKKINVEDQLQDNDSILNFYKDMIRIRKENIGLIYGKYTFVVEQKDEVYAYTRILDNQKYIIITNISKEYVIFKYNEEKLKYGGLLISNYKVEEHEDITEFILRPYEARLYRLY